jgi:hypothetical protein
MTMRRIAHCLILLTAPLTVQATEAASTSRGEGCTYTASDERGNEPAAASTSGGASATAPAKSGVGHSGGDDDLLPRLRAPKWHRFLPGMFR